MLFAHTPTNTRLDDGTVTNSVCTVFTNGRGKRISIALHDSCGRLVQLSRSDLRLFVEGGDDGFDDVTWSVFPCERGTIPATKENFELAWEWLHG